MALNQESILDSIKTLLNIVPEDTSFDEEIKIHINSAFSTLHQLGVGPTTAYAIESSAEKWGAFIGDRTEINSVKTYVYYEVRLAFDPPVTSFGISSFERMREELGWRLRIAVDPGVLLPETSDPLEI